MLYNNQGMRSDVTDSCEKGCDQHLQRYCHAVSVFNVGLEDVGDGLVA